MTQPLSLRPVPAELLKTREPAQCLAPQPDYAVQELEEAVVCERSEKEGALGQLGALQTAVKSREAAAKRAVAVAK